MNNNGQSNITDNADMTRLLLTTYILKGQKHAMYTTGAD